MRLLLLEDDARLSKLVIASLSNHFRVDHVRSYEDACDYIDHCCYDVVLLDRNINDMDIGMQLIARIKAASPETGVIILSAYDTIADKIAGLNLGADDYLDKPFDNDELIARINALSRRHLNTPTVMIEGLTCNTIHKTIHFDQNEIPLTRKQSDLFFYLLKKRRQIVSKEELLNALYVNPQNVSSNTLDVTISHLRKKLPLPIIKTVKTRGYMIE